MDYKAIQLCIPIVEDKGFDSIVNDHFGRSPIHMVVNLGNRTFKTIQKNSDRDCGEDHGHCMPVDLLAEHDVHVVAVKGIGRGAASRLMNKGIGVVSTDARTVSEVIDAYFDKHLDLISESNLCQGHHSGH